MDDRSEHAGSRQVMDFVWWSLDGISKHGAADESVVIEVQLELHGSA